MPWQANRVSADAARKSDGAIMLQQIALERIERGIVDVRREHALRADYRAPRRGLPHRAGGTLSHVARPKHARPNATLASDALPAVSECQHEQPRPAVLAGLRIAHHRAGAVIDLRFFARRSLDHRPCFRPSRSAQLADKALDALITGPKRMAVDQVLPDRFGVAAARKPQLNQFRGTARRRWPMDCDQVAVRAPLSSPTRRQSR